MRDYFGQKNAFPLSIGIMTTHGVDAESSEWMQIAFELWILRLILGTWNVSTVRIWIDRFFDVCMLCLFLLNC